jgi:hypothetical protein
MILLRLNFEHPGFWKDAVAAADGTKASGYLTTRVRISLILSLFSLPTPAIHVVESAQIPEYMSLVLSLPLPLSLPPSRPPSFSLSVRSPQFLLALALVRALASGCACLISMCVHT